MTPQSTTAPPLGVSMTPHENREWQSIGLNYPRRVKLWFKCFVCKRFSVNNTVCGKFTCDATCKTLAFSPLFFPSIAPALFLHTPIQFSEDSPSSFSFVKMSSPVHIHSGARSKTALRFTSKLYIWWKHVAGQSLIYLWIHLTVKHISLS